MSFTETDRQALSAAGITADEIAECESRKLLTDREKMQAMRDAGLTYSTIAASFGVSYATVRYKLDDEFRRSERERLNASARAKRRARGLKPTGFQPKQAVPESEMPLYDGGDVWVEPKVNRFDGLNCQDRQRLFDRWRKTGSIVSQRATKLQHADLRTGRVDDPAATLPTQPACEIAVRKHFAGDRTALSAYLESIGRAALVLPGNC